ncbi:MAG TPA: hypothetical protein VF868_16975 [Bacteroidia bacterium]|jgi:hypothetical protein
MREKLIELQELMHLLGCQDERTIQKWCRNHKVPILKLGKKSYVIEDFIDILIKKTVDKFVHANYKHPEEVISALHEDNKIALAELLDAPVNQGVKQKFRVAKNSKAAEKFLDQLNVA